MRLAALTFIAALGLAASTSAAPLIPSMDPQHNTNIVKVWWGGGGWGYHCNRWGYCGPHHRWGYWHRPWWRHHHYYGGGYYPGWRFREGYGY